MSQRFRTGWISDVHLGTKGCNAGAVLDFLRDYEFDTLYIVGDLIDGWKLRRGIYWPQEHSDVIQKILRKGRKGTKIIYIPGNHDEFLAGFLGIYGSITMKKNDIHITADGRRLLVMHGHELDTVVQNMRWLAFVGDVGYGFLLKTNQPLNWIRRHIRAGLLVAQLLCQAAHQERRLIRREIRGGGRALRRGLQGQRRGLRPYPLAGHPEDRRDRLL